MNSSFQIRDGVSTRSRLKLVLAVYGLLALACCSPPRRTPNAPGPNVVLITVDTLRADHLGCYGDSNIETPVIDSLAREGVVFTHAVSQVPLTAPSHAAILTGTYPFWNGFQSWSDPGLRPDVPTVAEKLKQHGYTTAAFVSAFVLDSMWGLSRGFDLYDDWFRTQDYQAMQNNDVRRRGGETMDRVLDWLRQPSRQPFFLWVHLYDPHLPYDPAEPFRTKYRGHLYDGEIAYDDQQIGRLFKLLKDQGLYSSSLIVLASDHGEGLGEHQERDHGFFIYNSTVRVPLIIKFPSGRRPGPKSISQVVNTVDIAPTLARLSGIPEAATRSFQGQSLVPLMEGNGEGPPRYGLSESLYPRDLLNAHSLVGVQTARFAYIRGAREELYDLESDPTEKHDLIRENAGVAASLRQAVIGLQTRYQPPQEAVAPRGSPNPKVVEKLQSLGYVSASRPPNGNAENPHAADPLDEIETYNQLLRATALAQFGRFQESNQVLLGLASTHPQLYIVAFMQGQNSLALGQAKAAEVHLRKALDINPVSTQAVFSLGQASYAVGDSAGAAKAYELALQLNPQDFLTQLALAKTYWRLKRLPEAASLQEHVLKSHPQFAQAYAEYGETLVQLRRLQEAASAMRKSIDLGYRDAFLYNVLGNALDALGKGAEARQAYEDAIKINADYVEPYANLAVLWDRLGDRHKAQGYFEEACRRNASVCRQLAPRFR